MIDTADLAYERCLDYVCQKAGIEHPSDEGYGKGWKLVRTEFVRQLTRITSAGLGLVLISHSVERTVKTRRGGEFDKIQPTMSGQARDVCEALVDIWAYYGYDGKDRVLHLLGDELYSAGHRVEGRFLYTDGTPIREFKTGRSSKEAWDRFVLAFNNEMVNPETLPKKKKKLKKED